MPKAKPKTAPKAAKKGKPARKVRVPTMLVHPEEMFCRLVAAGSSATDAYREAFPDRTDKQGSVWTLASRLRIEFGLRISEIQEELKKQTMQPWIASKLELLQFHTRVLRSPLSETAEDSDLIQEITRTYEGGQRGKLKRGNLDEGNEVTAPVKVIEKVKLPSKTDAAREISKINGHYADVKVDVGSSDLGSFFASIRSPKAK